MRTAMLVLFCGLLLMLAGCGSSSSTSNMHPTPSPTPTPSSPNPVPSPTPTPSPSPTPNPTPTPTAQSDSYLATLFFFVGRNTAPQGTITLDTTANNGAGNLQGFMESVNSHFTLQFCPYPQNSSNCTNITTFSSDASGFANVNFTFPMKGTFSGAFLIMDLGGNQAEGAGTGTSGTSFRSALLPAATITGGIGQTTGNSPGSGAASMNGTTAHITLSGAFPNHTFNTALCNLSNVCTALANITTDAQGNASADVGTVQATGWSVFRISDANGVQFVTAFRVQ